MVLPSFSYRPLTENCDDHVISVLPSGKISLVCGFDPRISITSFSDIPGLYRATSSSRMVLLPVKSESAVGLQEMDREHSNEVNTTSQEIFFSFISLGLLSAIYKVPYAGFNELPTSKCHFPLSTAFALKKPASSFESCPAALSLRLSAPGIFCGRRLAEPVLHVYGRTPLNAIIPQLNYYNSFDRPARTFSAESLKGKLWPGGEIPSGHSPVQF